MSSKRRVRPQRNSFRPRLEELEARIVPATFNESSIGGLISAIQTADGNSDASNKIVLAPGTYTLQGNTPSEIQIQDTPTTAKQLIIEGGTEQNTIIAGGTGWQDRIFEILGNNNLSVLFQNLAITGGNVQGKTGSAGAVSGAGGKGGDAEGGGIYMASGSLTLTSVAVSGNSATGGNGGAGGAGVAQLTNYAPTGDVNGKDGDPGEDGEGNAAAGSDGGDGEEGEEGAEAPSLKNGNGGDGGDGGNASGGGIYVASGQLTLSNATIGGNTVQGGDGGKGGGPGLHLSNNGYPGGNGGNGGSGGNGAAGTSETGRGGDGGKGGMAGDGAKGGDGVDGGDGGKGGDGGEADGGGLYLASGTLAVVSTSVKNNAAVGGNGGAGHGGGDGGDGGAGGNGGVGGNGGDAGAFFVGFTHTSQGSPSITKGGIGGGNGGDAGNGGNGDDGGDGGDGGKGGDGGDGGAAKGGGFYLADGTVTLVLATFDTNTATGGLGGVGGDGGLGGDGQGGGDGGDGGDGAIGDNGKDPGRAGQGGNGGSGGGGGKGGDGGDPGDGGSGGDGLGGSIYQAGGTLTIVRGAFSNGSAVGGGGGNGGAAGPGGNAGNAGNAGDGGSGASGTQSFPSVHGGFPPVPGAHGGNGGNGGSGGPGGNGGNAGHAGNGGNGQGGDIYVASGYTASLNDTTLSGTAQGGTAGGVGALGAGGDGGTGGAEGQAGQGGTGDPDGADGTDGEEGNDGATGSSGLASGPASPGVGGGATFGTIGSDTTPPTAALNAPNVTNANAGSLNPYTFTVAYSDPVLIDATTISGAVVQVQPPSGPPITATAINTVLSGLQDGQGDAQTITVTYQFTPPGGDWTSAPAGTYTVNLVSNAPKDLAGNATVTGTLGTFIVNLTAAPIVTSISPTTGPAGGGTSVTITGSGFTGATAVNFGGTAGTSLNVASDTQITVNAPAGSGIVDVEVVGPGGTSGAVAGDKFTYIATPVVTSISPTTGPAGGGTSVTITGSGFTGATAVNFGTTAGTSLNVVSDTQITVNAPAGSGIVDVEVVGPGGTSSAVAGDKFTYIAAGTPIVTSLSPNSGPIGGGSILAMMTINGSGFTGATKVQFGGTNATFFFVSAGGTAIYVVAPRHSAGAVDVTVTNAKGASATSAADRYTYLAAGAPSVTGLNSSSGPALGGNTLTIAGSGFTNATAVTFGATAATSFTVVNSTTITATAPAGAGTVDVTVTTPIGVSATKAADLYTFLAVPAVTGVSPANGFVGGNNTVTIAGTGFVQGGTAVSFGGVAATNFTVVNSSTITAVVPPAAGAGLVNVTVVTAGGTSGISSNDRYTYVVQAPSITSLSPPSGSTLGGNTVTINGSGFTGATGVTFGGKAGTGLDVVSDSQITVTAPAGTGVVTVTVTAPGGPANVSYTYIIAPTVTSISPNSGSIFGGNRVKIAGSGFTGVTAVQFGSVALSAAASLSFLSLGQFYVVSANEIDVDVPASPGWRSGPVNVTVTNGGGTSAAVPYTYSLFNLFGAMGFGAAKPSRQTT